MLTAQDVSCLLGLTLIAFASRSFAEAVPAAKKEASVFYPAKLLETAKENAKKYPWAAKMQKDIVSAAAPWMKFSDDELWALMFGNTLKRSWMVWSNGHCPACKKNVSMYNWQIHALERPWKVRCPHCQVLFPKNDFLKFYRSGLDEQGVFDPKRADRKLLFNAEHPNPQDPLYQFGVDDGDGYVANRNRWRFINHYLVFGQWKQAVLRGIVYLSAAYMVTGEKACAHKAGILLDRVADLYPTFDFKKDGVMYEGPASDGYISTWHDSCEETFELALCYDQVFEALRQDRALAEFLQRQAAAHKLANPKASFADVQQNIEERILRDALKNPAKIRCNYPRTGVTIASIRTILGWPGNRKEIQAALDEIVGGATTVDGTTGEKGLLCYSKLAVQAVAELLALYAPIDGFLPDMFKRHPRLAQMLRFFIDIHCIGKYYPAEGDGGAFATAVPEYIGVVFSKTQGLEPVFKKESVWQHLWPCSSYSFLWKVFEVTGDRTLAQVLYQNNNQTAEGLPFDLFADDPAALQKMVQEIVTADGPVPALKSVNKQQWHLAVLRGGQGERELAACLDYDSGGGHAHADGMNLGLFALGLDLLPDFGYPPVNKGGWGSSRFNWYQHTAAHNTVVVDGRDLADGAGRTTLWADGKAFHAVRASGPGLIRGKQYERTVLLLDASERDGYLLDIFRVVGGSEHVKFTHGHFGLLTPDGLALKPAADYGRETFMRNTQADAAPHVPWSVDLKVEDRHKLLAPGVEVHLRYTDLTAGAQALVAESWICNYTIDQEAWIPTVMVRRQSKEAPLASTFVSVLEPYEKKPALAGIRRLALEAADGTVCGENHAAVEIKLAGGAQDLLVSADADNPPPAGRVLVQKDWKLKLEGQLGWVRRDGLGAVRRVALCRGSSLTVGDLAIQLKQETEFVELAVEAGRAMVVAGASEVVQEVLFKGRNILAR